MSFGDSYIRTIMDADKEGQQQRVRDTIQKFGKLASTGDQAAMGEIYNVDPGGAASLETAFLNRNKAQADWDDYLQGEAGRVAYAVTQAPPERQQTELLRGVEYMSGLARNDPRLQPQIERLRTMATSQDPAVRAQIPAEMQGILDRSMSYTDRLQRSVPKTAEERAAAVLKPDDPVAQANLVLSLKNQPSYVNTQGGVIFRPGYNGQAGAGVPQGTMPFAAATQGAPKPLPGGATYIPVEKPPAQMSPATRASVADKIRTAEQEIRQTERLVPELGKLIKLIDDKVVDFGPYNNSTYEAQLQIGNPFGKASEGAKAYGNIKTFLSELVSGRLRLNVGPQTDSDAKRTAQEILDRFGDTNFVRGRLDYMRGLFEEDVAGRKRELEQYRMNSGFDQEPVSSYGGAGGPEMPADYGEDQFAPLPEEPASTVQGPARPTAPPPAPPPAAATAPAPTRLNSYAAAKAGPPPPPSENIGPLKRADVEAFARKHGLTVDQAYIIQMDRLQRRAR